MGKSRKKPRRKMNALQQNVSSAPKNKKDKDWSFDDIARSKVKRR